jgi:hypothetical protein
VVTTTRTRKEKIPKIVATFVYASSQGPIFESSTEADVQWSTNSCICVNLVYGVVQLGPKPIFSSGLKLLQLLFEYYTSYFGSLSL